jgi:2-keto-3-deoxy-L-rhamnonate aldolase RhmA
LLNIQFICIWWGNEIGTADLSYSMGGSEAAITTPEVQAGLRRIVAAGKANGIPIGCPAGSSQQMKSYIDMGFTFFQAPSDVTFMDRATRVWTQQLVDAGIIAPASPATPTPSVSPTRMY